MSANSQDKPSYILVSSFETRFRHDNVIGWMKQYWLPLVSIATVLYLAFIFLGQLILKDR